jgi:hypothetical protein
MSDIADRYAHLADGFLARIRATPGHRWESKSPCRGWTARDVVAHVVNGHRGILAMVHGVPPVAAHGVAVCVMADAPVVEPGADLAVAFTACRDGMLAVLRDPALAAIGYPAARWARSRWSVPSRCSAPSNCWATPGTWPAPRAATRPSTPMRSPAPTRR